MDLELPSCNLPSELPQAIGIRPNRVSREHYRGRNLGSGLQAKAQLEVVSA